MIMTIDDEIEIELKLMCLLEELLGADYSVDTEVCDDSVRVWIYEGPWGYGARLLSRLEYDLTVLEPGLEEAAKRIHLDWLFS